MVAIARTMVSLNIHFSDVEVAAALELIEAVSLSIVLIVAVAQTAFSSAFPLL